MAEGEEAVEFRALLALGRPNGNAIARHITIAYVTLAKVTERGPKPPQQPGGGLDRFRYRGITTSRHITHPKRTGGEDAEP